MSDYVNLNEAARETGLSIPTMRLKIKKGLLPGASQIPEGQRMLWRIPMSDLIAAGLIKVPEKEPSNSKMANNRTDALEKRLDQLEAELRHSQELLARADTELEGYRQRERQLFLVLETRQAQEDRKSLWQRFTNS